MSYVLVWEQRGVVKTFTGFISSQELADSFQAVTGHFKFDEIRYIISDFTAATCVTIDASAVEALVIARVGTYHTNPRVRVAVVGGSEAARFVAATNDGPLQGTRETRLFMTLALAREWLAVPPVSLSPS